MQFSPHPTPKGKATEERAPWLSRARTAGRLGLVHARTAEHRAPGSHCAPPGPGTAPCMAIATLGMDQPVCPHRGEAVSALGTPEPGPQPHPPPTSPSPSHGVSCLPAVAAATCHPTAKPRAGGTAQVPDSPRRGPVGARMSYSHPDLREEAVGAAGAPRGLLPPGPCLGAPLLAVTEESGQLPQLTSKGGAGGTRPLASGSAQQDPPPIRPGRSRPPLCPALGEALQTGGRPLTSP